MGWGLDIDAEAIRLCRAERRGGRLRVGSHAAVPLPAGALQPSLREPNLKQPAAVREAIREVCRQAGCRGWVAVALPDGAFSLRSLTTEALPAEREAARRFLAWQARELIPFPAEEARLDFLPPVGDPAGPLRVACLVARERVIAEYEGLLEEAGLRVGLADARTPCLAHACPPLLATEAAALLAVRNGRSTLLILTQGRPRLWRILPYGGAAWTGGGRLQALREIADSLTYAAEVEGVEGVRALVLDGLGAAAQEVAASLKSWLGLSVHPLVIESEAGAEGLGDFAPAIGAAVRPW